MKIFKILLLLLVLSEIQANASQWQLLQHLSDYSGSCFKLKKGVVYLELREYTRDKKSKETMRHTETPLVISHALLNSYPVSKVRRFKKLSPVLNSKTNIRKFTYCDYLGCVEHIANGFAIDNNDRLWKLNEIKDIWNYIKKIDTPAKIQLALWLNGKHSGTRYRKVTNGYEVIIESYKTSCDGNKDYEEYFTYSIHVDEHGNLSREKLLKHTKHEVQLVKKPAIYLYPRHKQKINVSLSINGAMTKSIPSYAKGWSVLVDTNGTIENKYDYLFYENTLETIELPNEGWIKQGNTLNVWFDAILPKLGLNAKEIEQFKEYWLKELDKDTLYEVKLFSLSFLSENMTLTIEPKPDTLIRVIFNFKVIKESYDIRAPFIITPTRIGFHVLEWGGMIEGEKR